jgi:hypothetical protein
MGDDFIERMSEVEADSVATALSSQENAVQTHFTAALKKLSDRHNPDYRNSIKESISAVESACKKLTGGQSGDLNRALQKLDKQKPFHRHSSSPWKSSMLGQTTRVEFGIASRMPRP